MIPSCFKIWSDLHGPPNSSKSFNGNWFTSDAQLNIEVGTNHSQEETMDENVVKGL